MEEQSQGHTTHVTRGNTGKNEGYFYNRLATYAVAKKVTREGVKPPYHTS